MPTILLTVRAMLLLCAITFVTLPSFCQAGSPTAQQPYHAQYIGDRSLTQIDKQYERLTATIHNQSARLLKRLRKQEAKLRKQLHSKDSARARALFEDAQNNYQQLQAKLDFPPGKEINNPLKEYIPGFDSLHTAMHFLEKTPGLPTAKLQKITQVNEQLQALQDKLQTANEIQHFIKQREQQLKEALGNATGLSRQLKGINQEVYYYQQRLSGYKELLNDRKKLEEKVLAAVRDLPAFKNFMQKHSYLAQLFGGPGSLDGAAPQALQGLQTRADVQGILQERLGAASTGSAAGADLRQYVGQQVQQARATMDKLKDKINELGGGGSGDMAIPDFKPDQQKTKSFLQRLEYGVNIQTQGTTNYLPAITDIAFSLGYKLKDGMAVGLGTAYKLGLGRGWNHIALSNQGISMRSYIDIRAKGSFWMSGGFEYQYMKEFENLTQVKQLSLWQNSALMGVTKKYKIGKKKEGKVQLLYDFLSAQQTPRGQALRFRIGYNL